MKFRVWHAGGSPDQDGVFVEALSSESAAQMGAVALFDADPSEDEETVDVIELFVARAGAMTLAKRFRVLVDVARVRFVQGKGRKIEAAFFIPSVVHSPAAV